MKNFLSALATAAIIFTLTSSADAATIKLEKPDISQSKMVAECLNQRKSSRNYFDQDLTRQQLSKILWAANGITKRYDGNGHVNPAAQGIYAVDVYAVMKDGIYLYKPESHSLELVQSGDYRSAVIRGHNSENVATLTLVYVENISAWNKARHKMPRDAQLNCANIAAGAMTQSVAVMAMAEELGNCVRGSIDKDAFKNAAKLKTTQNILIAQTVGEADNIPRG